MREKKRIIILGFLAFLLIISTTATAQALIPGQFTTTPINQFETYDEVKPVIKPLPYFPTPDEIWDPELYEELQPLHGL